MVMGSANKYQGREIKTNARFSNLTLKVGSNVQYTVPEAVNSKTIALIGFSLPI